MKTQHPPVRTFTVSGHRFDMLLVEGGVYRRGTEKDDPDAFGDEQPVREVRVPAFYLARLPVTQAFWRAVAGDNPGFFAGDARPVERVSWRDAQAFAEKLRRETRQPFRLPSEAEWEFAARGGIYNQNLKYAGSNRLKEVGWYEANSHGETKPAGRKHPNELGLFDMSGNVWEWCEDDWHNNYEEAPDNGRAWTDEPERGISRVYRGGGWLDAPQRCRVAYRIGWRPDYRLRVLGFRLALSLQGED